MPIKVIVAAVVLLAATLGALGTYRWWWRTYVDPGPSPYVTPLDLHAPDGVPIDILFLLICPTVHVHLAMLAKLASGLRDATFRAAVRERASFEEIVAMAGTVEGAFG